MEVLNDLVGKNLKIYQDNDYFKFSLESVILPSFVDIKLSDKKILDLCTGNAPIPLILSTKTKNQIIGVELQKEIYDLAIKTIKINNLENQITILNYNVKELNKIFPGDTFDIITVNPPYFKVNDNKYLNKNNIKSTARHEENLTLDELLKTVKYLLKNNASFYMVHRTERFIEIIEKLKEYNLEPKKIRFIFPFKKKESKLFMIMATKNGKTGLKILDNLYVHENDLLYTDEVLKMFE